MDRSLLASVLCVACFAALACDKNDDKPPPQKQPGPTSEAPPPAPPEKKAALEETPPEAAPSAPRIYEGCGAPARVTTMKTSDGVTLTADFIAARRPDRGAVVLLHMIPPANTRQGYPKGFLAALAALDVNIINLDRRGAGDSRGDAKAAYRGDGGRLDIEAAVDFLSAQAEVCPVDSKKLVLVGASNGTTSVLDYTLGRDNARPAPAALVWLSPGGYTELQHPIRKKDDLLNRLKTYPILWVYPDRENYSKGFQAWAKDELRHWRFVELKGGGHGTGNFKDPTHGPAQTRAILEWVELHVEDGE